MTPKEIACAITGVFDDGGICTPNSGMGRSRQIAQAITDVVRETREECAKFSESLGKDLGEPAVGAYIAKGIRKLNELSKP